MAFSYMSISLLLLFSFVTLTPSCLVTVALLHLFYSVFKACPQFKMAENKDIFMLERGISG